MSSTSSPVETAGGGGGDRVFLRKASGLIKTASTTDVFIFNIGLVSIGIGVGGLLLYGPSVYPGGNLVVGCIIAGALMSLIAFGMLTWTVTIPRSGGIYAFGSRILPPPIAFMLSVVESIAWLFFCGIAAYWVVTIGLIPMFTVLAAQADSQAMTDIADFLAKKWVTFLLGSLVLLLAGGILGAGMRRYFFAEAGRGGGGAGHAAPLRGDAVRLAQRLRQQLQRSVRPRRHLRQGHRIGQGGRLERSGLRPRADAQGVQLGLPSADRSRLLDRDRR
jgi:hypothetical protein